MFRIDCFLLFLSFSFFTNLDIRAQVAGDSSFFRAVENYQAQLNHDFPINIDPNALPFFSWEDKPYEITFINKGLDTAAFTLTEYGYLPDYCYQTKANLAPNDTFIGAFQTHTLKQDLLHFNGLEVHLLAGLDEKIEISLFRDSIAYHGKWSGLQAYYSDRAKIFGYSAIDRKYYREMNGAGNLTVFRNRIEDLTNKRLAHLDLWLDKLSSEEIHYAFCDLIYEHCMRYDNAIISKYRFNRSDSINLLLLHYNNWMENDLRLTPFPSSNYCWYYQAHLRQKWATAFFKEQQKTESSTNHNALSLRHLAASEEQKDILRLYLLTFNHEDSVMTGSVIEDLEFSSPQVSAFARKAYEKHALNISVGDQFDWTSFSAIHAPNQLHTDTEIRYKVIQFWSTACAPCMRKLNAQKNHYEEYLNKGIELVLICVDTPKARWQQIGIELGLIGQNHYAVNRSDNEFLFQLTNSLPRSVLLDQFNRVISSSFSGSLEQLVQETEQK
jgi:hypothetical protein